MNNRLLRLSLLGGALAIGLALGAGLSVGRAQTAHTITIQHAGTTQTRTTTAATVAEALWEAGFRLRRADVITPALAAPVTAGLTIQVTLARAITLTADGVTLTTLTTAPTVGEAVAQHGLMLLGLDTTRPAPDQPLPADGVIQVVRVREDRLIQQTAIPFGVQYQPLPEEAIDTVRTLQAGAEGYTRRVMLVRYEDGVEVARAVSAETRAVEPRPQIIGYGTRIDVRTLDTPDGPISYWRAYTVYATSYSPSRAGVPPTARNFGRTASGKLLTKGMVAVDRRYIPFGTRMYIPGYGFAVAEDTGGGVRGRFIDLGYDDHNYVGWSRVVTVYFLTPIPPANQIAWIIPPTLPR